VLEAYRERLSVPGEETNVWISGFFGSGKSSFAKVLGYLLEDRNLLGQTATERFFARTEAPAAKALLNVIHQQAAPVVVFVDLLSNRNVHREGESVVLPLTIREPVRVDHRFVDRSGKRVGRRVRRRIEYMQYSTGLLFGERDIATLLPRLSGELRRELLLECRKFLGRFEIDLELRVDDAAGVAQAVQQRSIERLPAQGRVAGSAGPERPAPLARGARRCLRFHLAGRADVGGPGSGRLVRRSRCSATTCSSASSTLMTSSIVRSIGRRKTSRIFIRSPLV
jgi:hypothetical protein